MRTCVYLQGDDLSIVPETEVRTHAINYPVRGTDSGSNVQVQLWIANTGLGNVLSKERR